MKRGSSPIYREAEARASSSWSTPRSVPVSESCVRICLLWPPPERCINIYSLPIRDQKLDGRFQQHGDMWDEVIHFHYFHCQYHFPEPVQKAPGNFPERSLHQVYRDPPDSRPLCSHPFR